VARVIRDLAVETVEAAVGRRHRDDPVLPGSGGPAGNARLTAWTGLVLLLLFLAELATLLDVGRFITWHLAIGVLLVPPALLKTGTTSWRILRYYTGNRPYREAGPPPSVLRLLGPIVVLSTWGVLGSGLLLVLLGPESSRNVFLRALGQRIDAITIHQGMFILWAVATGLHTLGRTVPALLTTRTGVRTPGRGWRVTTLVVTAVLAAIVTVVIVGAAGSWRSHPSHHFHRSTLGQSPSHHRPPIGTS
jgi:hypothetical protein